MDVGRKQKSIGLLKSNGGTVGMEKGDTLLAIKAASD